MTQMMIGRMFALIIAVGFSVLLVKDWDFGDKFNRLLAKAALAMMFIRGIGAIFFDIFNLFPLE